MCNFPGYPKELGLFLNFTWRGLEDLDIPGINEEEDEWQGVWNVENIWI